MSQTNDTPGIYFYTESKTDKRPYRIENRTQRLARLGVQLARLMGEMYKTQMTHSQIAELSSKTERLTAEILQLSESWEPSNE